MKHNTKNMVKGAAVVAAVGTTIGVVAASMTGRKKRKIKRTVNHAAKNISNMINTAQNMMK